MYNKAIIIIKICIQIHIYIAIISFLFLPVARNIKNSKSSIISLSHKTVTTKLVHNLSVMIQWVNMYDELVSASREPVR